MKFGELVGSSTQDTAESQKQAIDEGHVYVCVHNKNTWVANYPSKVKWAAQWKEAFPDATLWGTPGAEHGGTHAQGSLFPFGIRQWASSPNRTLLQLLSLAQSSIQPFANLVVQHSNSLCGPVFMVQGRVFRLSTWTIQKLSGFRQSRGGSSLPDTMNLHATLLIVSHGPPSNPSSQSPNPQNSEASDQIQNPETLLCGLCFPNSQVSGISRMNRLSKEGHSCSYGHLKRES